MTVFVIVWWVTTCGLRHRFTLTPTVYALVDRCKHRCYDRYNNAVLTSINQCIQSVSRCIHLDQLDVLLLVSNMFDICNRTYNTHQMYTALWSVLIVAALWRCDWLVAAGCRRPLQATSSCWLVGVNIIRVAISTWRFLEYCEECDWLIEEIRKYELLWKADHKDYGKHGPRMVAWKKIASTRIYRISLIIADVQMENCCT